MKIDKTVFTQRNKKSYKQTKTRTTKNNTQSSAVAGVGYNISSLPIAFPSDGVGPSKNISSRLSISFDQSQA